MDNLNLHSATDVLLFALAHPRWEFVFQPKYAAYLNLIEPWWKIRPSLALKGRRFETWPEIEEAVRRATAYWNEHKHPFLWDRRRRHRAPAAPGSPPRGRCRAKSRNNLADAPISAYGRRPGTHFSKMRSLTRFPLNPRKTPARGSRCSRAAARLQGCSDRRMRHAPRTAPLR